MSRWIPICFFAAVLIHPLSTNGEGQVYWTDSDSFQIQRASYDGTQLENIFVRFAPHALAIDTRRAQLYWTVGDSIQVSDLDGSNLRDLIVGLPKPQALALDIDGQRIYWSEKTTQRIRRASFDGTGIEDVLSGVGDVWSMALPVRGGHLYWSRNTPPEGVWRAELDGSHPQLLATGHGAYQVRAIAPDPFSGNVYWDSGGSIVRLSWPNGRPLLQTLVSSAGAFGLAIESSTSSIYWPQFFGERIRRSDYEGRNVETVLSSNMPYPTALAIGGAPPKIYWIDKFGINRADMDGSGRETIVKTHVGIPRGLAFDRARQLLFWAENSSSGRFTLGLPRWIRMGSIAEGTSTPLVESYTTPLGVAIDPLRHATYFAGGFCGCDVCNGGPQVWKIGWDGADHDLVSYQARNQSALRYVALDLARGKIYWSDLGGGGITCSGPTRILRSNLDGSSVEVIVDAANGFPEGLAIHVSANQLYWCDHGSGWIKRTDLQTGATDSIVQIADRYPIAIAVDPRLGQIFWTAMDFDRRIGGVYRANLDGSDARMIFNVLTGYHQFMGIALDPCPDGSSDDLLRIGLHAACQLGPGSFIRDDCHCADFTMDERVDLGDFAIVQRTWHWRR